ncbi:hypothetical protein OF83DRAFT_1086457 [Amylostereum chailletii]|nr:hypothetical protein OF83DRAFT_1086457 [Amylostereum chailletii]
MVQLCKDTWPRSQFFLSSSIHPHPFPSPPSSPALVLRPHLPPLRSLPAALGFHPRLPPASALVRCLLLPLSAARPLPSSSTLIRRPRPLPSSATLVRRPRPLPSSAALVHFREILSALRKCCAPLRNAYIDALLARLADPPPSSALPDLAKLIVDTVHNILQLADAMKDNLSQFVMGMMSEAQLWETIHDQARKGERALMLDLWRLTSLKAVVAEWTAQLATPYSGVANAGDHVWIVRLMQALGATTPVACPMPTKPVPSSGDNTEPPPALPNVLPPPFFFSTPELEYIQNLLQALTPLTTSIGSESSADDTKLINLADDGEPRTEVRTEFEPRTEVQFRFRFGFTPRHVGSGSGSGKMGPEPNRTELRQHYF